MTLFDILITLHVLGIVWWLGGVALITTVYLPMLHFLPNQERKVRIEQIEGRFAWQARISILVIGGTGFWMLSRMGGPQLLELRQAWWLNFMIFVWLLFFLMLFVFEPLRMLDKTGLIEHRVAFLVLHVILLILALMVVACGILGSRGAFG